MIDPWFLDNLERSIAAHLTDALANADGGNVKPGRRAGVVEPRPAIGIAWLSWTPNRKTWGGTWPDVVLRIYVYSVKNNKDEQADHKEEGRLHLAVLAALEDQATIPVLDYRLDTPTETRRVELEWVAGVNPPDPQVRSRSETWFDVIAKTQEG
jgi:hypothetical protein